MRETDLVRGFNRFYTRQIGLLREGLLETPYSLTQARVLYELGSRPGLRSANLVAELGLDAGYLSRLLRGFARKGLVKRSPSKDDRRAHHLSLTARGRAEFERLNARSRADIEQMLARFNPAGRRRLTDSMTAIRELLDGPAPGGGDVVLRGHRPGDIGWVVARHGEIYAQEYGWDSTFEGLVAEIAGKFLQKHEPHAERCWIAERDGERLGCVFLVRHSKTVAKLRLLLVEPGARGLGIGGRLVAACTEFARQCGYRKITLWTNSVLHAARRIYERAGFHLVSEKRGHLFGHELTSQVWELELY